MSDASLNPVERRAISGLTAVYGLRMLGLFMVLPVMPLLLQTFEGATPLAIGLAIGIYGLTQALLQLPFGLLSDRFGRKQLIYLSLLLFALGSLVAALADSLLWFIVGRALQGAGAVASVLMALLADLTRDEKRTQAMASIGISIGLSFILAMSAGPWLAGWIGLSGLFWTIFILNLLGVLVIWRWVPSPVRVRQHLDAGIRASEIWSVIRHPQLLRLDFSILLLHLVLTAVFIAIPGLLQHNGWALAQHSWIYLFSMGLGFVLMIPLIIRGEKGNRMKSSLLTGFVLLALALLLMAYRQNTLTLLIGLVVFFVGFNLLEASLPSLVSKQASVRSKGTAMGVYSSGQFLGSFLGGVLGGLLLTHWGVVPLLLSAACVCALWLLVLAGYRAPAKLSSRVFSLPVGHPSSLAELAQQLKAIPGIVEVVLVAEEQTGYLKVDAARLDQAKLDTLLGMH